MAEMMGVEFQYRVESIEGWDVPILEFVESVGSVSSLVLGIIGNSVTTSDRGKKITLDWKRNVMAVVKAVRGGAWDSSRQYSVSLGMKFNPKNHYHQKLDVENFIKPVLDAVAAGLFCPEDTNPWDIERWGYDDSNFRTLFFHRFPDARDPGDEGVAIHVSAI